MVLMCACTSNLGGARRLEFTMESSGGGDRRPVRMGGAPRGGGQPLGVAGGVGGGSHRGAALAPHLPRV